jgi:hypothetical protein
LLSTVPAEGPVPVVRIDRIQTSGVGDSEIRAVGIHNDGCPISPSSGASLVTVFPFSSQRLFSLLDALAHRDHLQNEVKDLAS